MVICMAYLDVSSLFDVYYGGVGKLEILGGLLKALFAL